MRISVVIAAYKGEKFIAEQLTSLAEQILPPDEVVICDDSPDELTENVIRQFSGKLNIRYFRNGQILGINGNFAKAISLADGDIIFLCDQDDFWHKDKISKMVQCLENAPGADGVFCDSAAVDEERKSLGFSLWQMRNFSRRMREDVEKGDVLKVFLKRVTLSAHNIAFRKRALKYILPLPELVPFYPDTWIGLRIALLSDWVKVDEQLTDYRIHGNNQSAPELAGIAGQMRLSRKARSKNSLGVTVELADALEKIPENFSLPLEKRIMLASFRKHYAVRSKYSANILLRSIQICREILSMRYWRYSNGWKSIAADLFISR